MSIDEGPFQNLIAINFPADEEPPPPPSTTKTYFIGGNLTGSQSVYSFGSTTDFPSSVGSLNAIAYDLIWFGGYLWAGEEYPKRFNGVNWIDYTTGYEAFGPNTVDHFYVHNGELYYHLSLNDFLGTTSIIYKYNSGTDSFGVETSSIAAEADGRVAFAENGSGILHCFITGYRVWDKDPSWASFVTMSQPSSAAVFSGSTAYVAGANGTPQGGTYTFNTMNASGTFTIIDSTTDGGEYKYQAQAEGYAGGLGRTACNAVVWNGGIYVGGIERVSSTSTEGLLKLTSSSVSLELSSGTKTAGTPPVNRVLALSGSDTSLLVGGSFTSLGGVSAKRAALVTYDGGYTVTPFDWGPSSGYVSACLIIEGDDPPVLENVANDSVSEGPYSVQVNLLSGTVTAWSLEESPSGATIDSDGLVEWTAVAAGSPHTFIAYAYNSGGWDATTWTVTVT